MEHETHYGELMGELINIFIPPENAAPEQLEEAKRNMEKYADYRTYLSFDMQQLVQNGDEVIKIRLSRSCAKIPAARGKTPSMWPFLPALLRPTASDSLCVCAEALPSAW